MNSGLDIDNLTVTYGGITAVDGLTLHAPLGACTGLIGPNGAGKTSVFNACFGLIPSATGEVKVLGRSITGMIPSARARAGLARTFQRMELFDSLTVRENVEMGREAAWVGASMFRALYRSRAGASAVREAWQEASALCGITELEAAPVGSLSTGQRRLVEFARVLANPAQVVLLDEPSSGLDHAETSHFARVLRRAVDERQLGVVLVEHDMELVAEVCQDVHVIDFGTKIFEGPMSVAKNDPGVRAAYLGATDELTSTNEV